MPIPLSGTNLKRGAIHTGNRNAADVLEEKRQTLFRQEPLKGASLIKMVQMLPKSSTNNAVFQWAEERFPARNGAVTDVYTDAGLSSAYSSGQNAGTAVYIKMAEDNAKQIIPSQQLLISSESSSADGYDVTVDVKNVSLAGSSSFITAVLLVNDSNNALSSATLSWRISGNAQSEMSGLPGNVSEDPTWYENCTQIFRGAVRISGTQLASKSVFTESKYKSMKRQAFGQMMMDMQRSCIFGIFNKTSVGENGMPRRFTRGIKSALETYESDNVIKCTSWTKTGVTTSSKTWLEYGYDLLDDVMNRTSIYSSGPKKVLCGDLVMSAVSALVRDAGEIQLTPDFEDEFGINVNRLRGMRTTLDFIEDPLFTTDDRLRRSALIFQPQLFEYRHIEGRDVRFVPAKELSGQDQIDGIEEGWIAECGLEWKNLSHCAWLDGFGRTHN